MKETPLKLMRIQVDPCYINTKTMKRYLRGWIYSKILHGRKLLLLGSFLAFYLGLSVSPIDNLLQKEPQLKEIKLGICIEENRSFDWLKKE